MKRLTWLREWCSHGPTCPRIGVYGDQVVVQGYVITDPELLDETGEVPGGEGLLVLPRSMFPEL